MELLHQPGIVCGFAGTEVCELGLLGVVKELPADLGGESLGPLIEYDLLFQARIVYHRALGTVVTVDSDDLVHDHPGILHHLKVRTGEVRSDESGQCGGDAEPGSGEGDVGTGPSECGLLGGDVNGLVEAREVFH